MDCFEYVYSLVSPVETLDNYQTRTDTLKIHNHLRAKHGAHALTLNSDLNTLAQSHADYLASTEKFQHSDNTNFNGSPLGENVAMQWSTDKKEYKGELATQQWYEEIKLYDFKSKTPRAGTGHFTQLVWKETRELGVGRAKSRDGTKWYVVANYFPAGNYVGQYGANVVHG